MSIKLDGICVIPENIYPYHSPIVFGVKGNCNGIFDGDILSGGYQTRSENYGNFRGCKGEYDKHPLEWKFQGDGGMK